MRIIATIVLALFAITSAVPAVPAEAATIDEMKAYIEDVALDYDLSPELVMCLGVSALMLSFPWCCRLRC